MSETPEQHAAEAKLDEVTREVAAEELERETDRESTYVFGKWRGIYRRGGILGRWWGRLPRLPAPGRKE